MRVYIEDTDYFLPEKVMTNDDLKQEHPTWNMDQIEMKSGVHQRHFAGDNETSLDLAIRACDKIFARHDKNLIDGILFCTQTPDYIMPSNAFLIQNQFNLRRDIFAFDYNLACSGFVYGLVIAQGFILSGLAQRLLLVTADTYSKLINKNDRSCLCLFGDGATATLISASPSNVGIVDIKLGSAGNLWKSFYVPAGGFRLCKSEITSAESVDANGNVHSLNDIHMDGLRVWGFINSEVPVQIRNLMMRNNLSIEDVDLFLFHQASKMTLDSLVRILDISDKQLFTNLAYVGNTISSSIPIALRDAQNQGRIKPGNRIILSAFGVGLSFGTLLMQT